jgi:group II intron reverse transcriptase/maturase
MCSHSGETSTQDDGGLVVPAQRPEASSSGAELGRGLGKTIKVKSDERCRSSPPDDEFYNPTDEDFSKLVGKWRDSDKTSRGVTILPRLIKLTETCIKDTSCKVDDIYRILYKPGIYDLAYSQIKSNPGNMTPGSDGSTLDGNHLNRWSSELVDSIISKMKDESFQFTPARVVGIPKQDGTKRQLKVAPPKDKIVQRILAWILEAIYEPIFVKESFGFRPNLGCHDALKHIELKYNGARWFIEGDISKCFGDIDHSILLNILRRRIKDEKFMRLVAKALKAGYLNQWKVPQDCIAGTPQGSIVSPILCNIFMNEFDNFVLKKLVPKFNRGKARAQPPEYKRLAASSYQMSKRYEVTKDPVYLEKARAVRKKFQTMSSVLVNDPNFRRLVYCRYADDWLIAFSGTYSEAVEIRAPRAKFLGPARPGNSAPDWGHFKP